MLIIPYLFAIISGCCTKLEYEFDTKVINVPLDHYSFTQNETFKLKYLVNGRYHVKGGPVFLYTGNEGDISMFAQNTGFLFDIAPTLNALVVFAEHRYYGSSMPFGNKSLSSPDTLKYLTTSQALADFVYIIEELRKTYFSTVISRDTYPFVAFGGSYGGMLAAWLRMKYPTSVVGAIASSAPIWFFDDLTPCDKYYEIITNVFDKFGTTNCTNTIRSSWDIIRNITRTNEGKQYLTSLWRICNKLDTSSDIDNLIDWISDIYFDLAMSNYPYPTSFIRPLPAYPVKVFCDKLDSLSSKNKNNTKQLLENLGNALEVYTNYTGKTSCNNINVTSDDLTERAWDYQACTELVTPMCSTQKDMFETQPWDPKKYDDDCFKKFGVRSRSPNWPILEYGGKNLRYFSNIVFSNGLMDPWSCAGVLSNVSSSIWAINITDAAHHVDLRSSDPADTNYVVEARKFHMKAIRKWLNIS